MTEDLIYPGMALVIAIAAMASGIVAWQLRHLAKPQPRRIKIDSREERRGLPRR
jgi:hypothetical protein